jgi:excisionase family DNA binding protein
MSKNEAINRLTVPVWPDAAQTLGIGRNAAYDAIARGEIPVIRLGRKLLVPKRALERLANGDPAPDGENLKPGIVGNA